MHKVLVIQGFVLYFLINLTGAVKEICRDKGEDLLQKCTVALPVLSSPEISFAVTREELDKSCVGLKSGIHCIENYTEVCMEKNERAVFMRIYSGITAVVQDLCTRGPYQDEYLRHADCVKNVRPEYEVCSKKYEVTLTLLDSEQGNGQYNSEVLDESSHENKLRTVCCSFQEYLTCSEQTVQRSCGDEAAEFTGKFLKRMSEDINKNYCMVYKGHECRGINNSVSSGNSILLTFTILLLSHLFIRQFNKL